jgi:hypothetical protein
VGRVVPPKHRLPIDRLGRADRDQADRLALDFAPALLIFVVLPAAIVAGDRGIVFWPLAGLFSVTGWIALSRRARTVSVDVGDGKIRIRNVFRNWTIDPGDVTEVVVRNAWFGGLYADCYGLRRRGPWSLRSVPMHAIVGGTDGIPEVERLLGISTSQGA